MTAPQEVVAEPRKRLPLLVGGGVALGLVLFLVTKMMGGGGGDDAVAPSSAATTATTVAPAAAVPAAPAPAEAAKVINTKNPFVPLRTAVAPGAPASPAVAPGAPRPSARVALLDVFPEGNRLVANVRVNGAESKVALGDTFSSNFKVVSLEATQRCARLLFGDVQFHICKGEEVQK